MQAASSLLTILDLSFTSAFSPGIDFTQKSRDDDQNDFEVNDSN